MGRPSDYTPEIETAICDAIASGKSLREICKADDMPGRETVYGWMGKNQAFADRYTRAVEDRAEKLAEELIDIADEKSGDPARDRLRVDARKWVASKLFPKKYGDKVTNEVTGAEGGPVQFSCTVNLVRPNGTSGQG